MFAGLITRETLRHLLDVAGLLMLLLACQFHSWTLDGVGIGLLLLATLMYPPFTGFGAKVARGVLSWFSFTFLFAREFADDDDEEGDTTGARPRRPDWDLRDSAYVQQVIRDNDPQLSFAFMGRSFGSEEQEAYYQRCTYSVTPCGKPTSVRAWGDLH